MPRVLLHVAKSAIAPLAALLVLTGLLFSFILKAMCGDPYQGFSWCSLLLQQEWPINSSAPLSWSAARVPSSEALKQKVHVHTLPHRSFQNTVWAWAGWKSMSPDTSQRSALDPSHRFAYDASVRSAFDASQRSARDASQRSAREPLFREPLLREPLLREPLLNGQEQKEPVGQQQC
eukprot:32224-Pelagomonas_calceolata.AAC.3